MYFIYSWRKQDNYKTISSNVMSSANFYAYVYDKTMAPQLYWLT